MSSPQDTSTRKLAAIMFTDIKAFSWKMATDEMAAMQILKTHDGMMKESIEQYGGRVIKSIGDSFMVDFPSAVNGVTCAMELQHRFWEFNKGKTDFSKIEVRMGLHLGDVIDVGNDMYGDGVNIASRVEAITEPNRICITQDIYNQVKKKMSSLNVFAIGPMKFKNIDDPVEVYEILMDDIPELSEPSQTAKQAPSRKAAEKSVEREAKEAKSVEARKKKLQGDNSEKIKMHYRKAEIFFQKGKLDEAEAELAEIEKLTGGGAEQADQGVDKEEEEKQKKIQSHYKKAEEAFHKGQLDDAEKEIQEIYSMVPMHYGAQMIMAQIEEERFRLAEERRRKIESERRSLQEKTEQLDALRARIQTLIEQEQYTDALEVAEEMLAIDPENGEAKQFRQRVEKLKKDKEDLERASSEEAERVLQATLDRRTEQAKTFEPKVEDVPVVKVPLNKKLIMQVAGAVAAVVLLYVIITFIKSTFFPNTASLAVLVTGNAPVNSLDNHATRSLAILLAEDFARLEHVTTASASSALTGRRSGKTKEELASDLGVRQLVLVSIQQDNDEVSVQAELFDVENKTVWTETLTADNLLKMPDMRVGVVNTVMDRLGVNSELSELSAPTRNAQAFQSYVVGLSLLGQRSVPALLLAIDTLSVAVQLDNSFGTAYVTRAAAYVELFKLLGESNTTLLDNASRDLQSAGTSRNSALTSRVAGTIHRYRQKFSDARQAIEQSLSLQPQSAASYRELALLALPYGNYDEATTHANRAIILDPKNSESLITAGIVAHFKKEYQRALTLYDNGITAGADDSLVTVRYRLSAWASLQMRKEAEDYCKELQQKYPQEYRTNYWVARALNQRGQVEEAKPFLDRAYSITDKARDSNKNDVILHGFIAVIKARQAKFDDAEKEINAAIQLHGPRPSLLFRKAHVYAIQGQQGEEKVFTALKAAVDAEFNIAEILSPEFIGAQNKPEFATAIVRASASQ